MNTDSSSVFKTNKHWCQYCRIFVTNRKHHESGNRHQYNVKHFLRQQKLRNAKQEKEQQNVDREFERIERAAQRAMQRDVASGNVAATDSSAAPFVQVAQQHRRTAQTSFPGQQPHHHVYGQQHQQHQQQQQYQHQQYQQKQQQQQVWQQQQAYANYDANYYQNMTPEQRAYYEQYYHQYYQHYYGSQAAAAAATTTDGIIMPAQQAYDHLQQQGLDASDVPIDGAGVQRLDAASDHVQKMLEPDHREAKSGDAENDQQQQQEEEEEEEEYVEYVEEIVEVYEDEEEGDNRNGASAELPDAYYNDPNFFYTMESYEENQRLEERQQEEAEKRRLDRERRLEEEKELKKKQEREMKIEQMKKEYERDHGSSSSQASAAASGIGGWTRVEQSDVQRLPSSRRAGQTDAMESHSAASEEHADVRPSRSDKDDDDDEYYDLHTLGEGDDEDTFGTSSYRYGSSTRSDSKKRPLSHADDCKISMQESPKKQKTGLISFQIKPVAKKDIPR